MKKIKTVVSLLVTAALLVLAPGANKLPVSAEEQREPVTYIIKYVDSAENWRYQTGEGYWRDYLSHRSLYYMLQDIQDGDILVIEGSAPKRLELNLSVKLSNITFSKADNVIVTTTAADTVYVLRNCVVAFNGDVTNAHVYDNARVNFNNNVTNLYVREADSADQTIAVLGTVGYCETSDTDLIYQQFYSFPENTFRMDEGTLKTEAFHYSIVPPVVPVPGM